MSASELAEGHSPQAARYVTGKLYLLSDVNLLESLHCQLLHCARFRGLGGGLHDRALWRQTQRPSTTSRSEIRAGERCHLTAPESPRLFIGDHNQAGHVPWCMHTALHQSDLWGERGAPFLWPQC